MRRSPDFRDSRWRGFFYGRQEDERRHDDGRFTLCI